MNEYTSRLSMLSTVSYDFIIELTKSTVFTSEDLYHFYCMAARFPTIEEMNIAFKIGFRNLYNMMNLTNSKPIKLENLVIDNFDKAEFDSLDLTPQAEITRLQKVLKEKNTLIADFKQYDEERKRYIHRLEKQIITLRNKNQELNKRITK